MDENPVTAISLIGSAGVALFLLMRYRRTLWKDTKDMFNKNLKRLTDVIDEKKQKLSLFRSANHDQ